MAIRAFDPREKSSQMTSAQIRVESKLLDDLEHRVGKFSASIDTRFRKHTDELISEIKALMREHMAAITRKLENSEALTLPAEKKSFSQGAEVFDEMPDSTIQSNYSDFLRTLMVEVHETSYPVTIETLHQIFEEYGVVEEIDILPNVETFQALVRYKSMESSLSAMYSLHNRCIYEGCCWLDIKKLSYTLLEEVLERHNSIGQIHSDLEMKLKLMYAAVKKVESPCKLEPSPLNNSVPSIILRESSIDVDVVYSNEDFIELSGDNIPAKTVAKVLGKLATKKLGVVDYVEILKEEQPTENQQFTIEPASHLNEWSIEDDEFEGDYDDASLDHKCELIHVPFDPGGGPKGKYEALENIGNDSIGLAMHSKPDPIIGCDGKTRRCIRILSRITRSKHVIIGELGVVQIAKLAQMIISRNDNNVVRLHFPGEILRLIIRQKKMILSDENVFAALFTSLLSSSSDSHLVQPAAEKRFTDTLLCMLHFAPGPSVQATMKLLSAAKGVGSKILSTLGVRSRLNDRLEWCHRYYFGDQLCCELSKGEVDILCLLLESSTRPTPSYASSLYGDWKIRAQELIFCSLLVLFRSANGVVQNSTRDTLVRANLNRSIIGSVLDSILNQKPDSIGLAQGKKQKESTKFEEGSQRNDATQNRENTLSFMSDFLDVLRVKKDRTLIGPLLKLLQLVFRNDEWVHKAANQEKVRASSSSEFVFNNTTYIQQTLLLTLEEITASIENSSPTRGIAHNFDLQLIVSCARSFNDAVTRNNVFALITTCANIFSGKVLDRNLDILTAMGKSTVLQWDSYSRHVFEGLVLAFVSCWLSRTNDMEQPLQILNIQLQVAEHKRLSIITHIQGALGEAGRMGSLLFLLFYSLLLRENLLMNEPYLDHLTSIINKQREYEFSAQLGELYSCTVWLPSLILAPQEIRSNELSQKMFMPRLIAMVFVAEKLRHSEISYKFDAGEDLNNIPTMIDELMEQVVFQLQLVDPTSKNISAQVVIKSELKEYIRAVLKTLTKGLQLPIYFTVITKLDGHADTNVRQKACGLLCEIVKDLGANARIKKQVVLPESMDSFRALWSVLKTAITRTKTWGQVSQRGGICQELITKAGNQHSKEKHVLSLINKTMSFRGGKGHFREIAQLIRVQPIQNQHVDGRLSNSKGDVKKKISFCSVKVLQLG